MSKYVNDVRSLSSNPAYQGVEFSGSMDEALRQARAAPEHGLAEQYVPQGMSRDRAALLQHLNLLPHYSGEAVMAREIELTFDIAADEARHDDEEDDWLLEQLQDPVYEDRNWLVPAEGTPVISKYSLGYAQSRGWVQ